jgi:hypothetical protein
MEKSQFLISIVSPLKTKRSKLRTVLLKIIGLLQMVPIERSYGKNRVG